MTTVAVTGACGLVGAPVVRQLAATEGIDEIIAIDVVEPAEPLPATFRQGDVTDRDSMVTALAGADVIVHLAARFDTGHDVDRIRAVNVDGVKLVAEVAAEVGAHKLLVTSSASAYGAHPDNDLPLSEESPLRANPGLPYAEHKREIDLWLQHWAAGEPDMTVTILRPAIVMGRGAANFAVRALLMPRIPIIRGHRPPLQFVHLDDVVSAIVHVVIHDLPGAYNVGAEGWLSLEEISAILGRRFVEVPEEVAFAAAERSYRLGVGDLPEGTVHYFMHPWVVSVDKLIATGWRPAHTNRDALAAFVTAHGHEIVAGPLHTTKTQVRGAAIAGAGLVGGVLALGILSRRRHRGDDG